MREESLVVVVDTREQRPWTFSPEVTTVRGTLSAGDYSVQGLEDRVRIERKSLDDFVACCTRERARFVRELERLTAYDFRVLIVEASLLDVAAHAYRSKAMPRSIVASSVAFHVDFGVPTIWAGDHRRAGRVAEMLLGRFAKRAKKDAA